MHGKVRDYRLRCNAGPDGSSKDATFKISRAADSVKWTAYDASGKVIDSETAKK